MRFFRLAANQGYDFAQQYLGVMYEQGQGVPQNYAEAVRWYRLAADQGNAFAQVSLALMYEGGVGVPLDFVQAHMWFDLTAARAAPGVSRDSAVGHRDRLAARMTPAQIAEAQRLAREWAAAHPQTR